MGVGTDGGDAVDESDDDDDGGDGVDGGDYGDGGDDGVWGLAMMAIGCLMLVYWELVQTMLSQVIPFNSPHLREVNEDDAEF